ncbi:MAG: hypothetical protein JSW58_16975 [Candidatus Latescibacterota bacterium]|nr:MAG: hypothetical protein JSW58_16975 [Candidatus Latescibacterota bacterium]
MKSHPTRAMSPSSLVLAILLAAPVVFGGCSRFYRQSTSDRPTHAFVLTVEDTRTDTGYHAETDSIYEIGFESKTSHFGRVEATGEMPEMTFEVFGDSILFSQERPFRIEAFMSLETRRIASKEPGSAIHTGELEIDDSMLECLFAGPSLRISFGGEGASPQIEHLKSDCPGGIYQRLNLPDLFRFLIIRIPPDRHDVGSVWQITETIPSLSGLGFRPRLHFRYHVIEPTVEPGRVDRHMDYLYVTYRCDSIIKNDRSTMPNGETVNILSDRVAGGGYLIVERDSGFPVAGAVGLNEDIHYVRPDLESPVLKKECQYYARMIDPSRPWLRLPAKGPQSP